MKLKLTTVSAFPKTPLAVGTLIVFAAGSMSPDVVTDYAVGRQGEALKQTLRKYCSPSHLLNTEYSEAQYRAALLELQSDGSGGVTDFVTGRTYGYTDAVASLASCYFVYPSWLGVPVDYRRNAPLDLFNSMLACGDLLTARRSGEGFAVAGDADAKNDGVWSKSTVTLDGWTMGIIEPADSRKGAIARRYFYFSTVYPFTIWGGDGVKFFTSQEYPGLTGWASSIYLSWHRAYPVDASELLANDVAERLQGNRNPFVDYPDLVEYLWGEHAGEIYRGNGGSAEGPDVPPTGDDDDIVRIPLRGTYRLSDRWLDLYSPYVGDDATWTIDGVEQHDMRVELSRIGTGHHELKYTAPGVTGKLLITVEQ